MRVVECDGPHVVEQATQVGIVGDGRLASLEQELRAGGRRQGQLPEQLVDDTPADD